MSSLVAKETITFLLDKAPKILYTSSSKPLSIFILSSLKSLTSVFDKSKASSGYPKEIRFLIVNSCNSAQKPDDLAISSSSSVSSRYHIVRAF